VARSVAIGLTTERSQGFVPSVVSLSRKTPQRPETLSERELDVLRLLARGLANKEISRDLGIAEKTVKTHVSSILGKLGIQSRTQAALYAGRVGVVPVNQLGQASPPTSHHSSSAVRPSTEP
jgi:DNA-binding NarL/FixJ family response regulator